MTDTIPEPDRIENAPHPRETVHLFGQDAAEAEFLQAFNNRMHHGWMITGPRGVVRSEERRVGKECRSRWSPYH